MCKKIVVAVLPLNNVSKIEIDFAEKTLREQFGVEVVVMPTHTLCKDMYDSARHQWDADRILDLLFTMLPENCSRIIGVAAEDMFAKERTFVFGYAHLRDGVALYSAARHYEEWYNRKENIALQQSRSFRVIMHEIGHTFGNSHCEAKCVMHSVEQVDSLDTLEPTFCCGCAKRVRRGLKIRHDSAEGQFLRAGALLRRKNLLGAIAAYTSACEKDPYEARYQNDLGVALLNAGMRDKARIAFARAVALEPDFPHPYYNTGILFGGEGDAEKAEPWLDKGLQYDPDKKKAHNYLAKIYEDIFSDSVRALRHSNAAARYKEEG